MCALIAGFGSPLLHVELTKTIPLCTKTALLLHRNRIDLHNGRERDFVLQRSKHHRVASKRRRIARRCNAELVGQKGSAVCRRKSPASGAVKNVCVIRTTSRIASRQLF
jgi:hypothetical protein